MNYLKKLFLLLTAFFFVHALQAKIQVLLLDGQNNHNWKATTPVMVDTLEGSGHFNVTVSTSPPKKSEPSVWKKWNPQFNSYDVTLSNYNGEMWPKEVQDNLINYVQRGGAFVVVHAANNAFGQWREYNQMIGLGGWGGRNEKSGPYLFFNDSENWSGIQDRVEEAVMAHSMNLLFKFVILNIQLPKVCRKNGYTVRMNFMIHCVDRLKM